MIKRLLLLLLILVIPIGGYLWYRQTPEQQIARTVDQFLENVEHRKTSTRLQTDVHEALGEVLAQKIKVKGKFPSPIGELDIDEIMTPDEVLDKVDWLHLITNRIEITEVERTIKIIGSEAQVYQTVDVLGVVGIGKGQKRDQQTWDLTVDLEKGEDWRIVGVRGSQQ